MQFLLSRNMTYQIVLPSKKHIYIYVLFVVGNGTQVHIRPRERGEIF